MTTESTASTESAESVQRPALESEILRLRQQLAAREEVIAQLNRRIVDIPDTTYVGELEPDQDALADAWADGRALNEELQRLREVVAQQKSEIVHWRHQLEVYDRLGVSGTVGGVQKVWALLRRVGGRT